MFARFLFCAFAAVLMTLGAAVVEVADLDVGAVAVVATAKAAGFDNLKGHKSVGGLRASIYNAMPKEGVEALVEFLKKYEAEHA